MNGWTIQRKVNVICGSGLLLSLLAIGTSALGLRQIVASLNEIVVTGDALQSHQVADMMHDALRGDVQRALLAEDENELREAQNDLQEHSKIFLDAMEKNEGRALSPEIKQALRQSKQELSVYVEASRDMLNTRQRDRAAAAAKMAQFLKHFEALEGKNEAVSKLIEASVESSRGSAYTDVQRAGITLGVIAVLLVIVGAGTIISIGRIVGDLKTKLAAVSTGVHRVAEFASRIGSSSSQVVGAANEQAESLNRTEQSTEKIRESAQRNADLTRVAMDTMEQTSNRIEDANGRLKEMVDSIGGISAASGEISKIIQVIETIAFQTNLLALNAAVEAARAGEVGAGFAVVADEVRALAQRSSEAAKDTARLIEETIRRSQEGNDKVQSVSKAIEEVTSNATKMKQLVMEVTESTQLEARGVAEVAGFLSDMQKVNQRSATTMRGTADSASELGEESEHLQQSAQELSEMAVAC